MKVFIFPGQGSQHVGMGREVYDAFPCAREVFQEVDEVLQQKLSKMMFEGPEEELVRTENTQPALMTASMAMMRVLEKEGGYLLPQLASYVAGHSLGQYTALCAADALNLQDTARLLKLRGQAMQQAVPQGVGAMAAVLGLEIPAVEEIVVGLCEIANDNSPGQVVISGSREGVEKAAELAKEQGAKKVVMLNVSAPFHCSLMAPAQGPMAEALAKVTLMDPRIPVVDNVSAKPVPQGESFRQLLVDQITGRVRWRESLLNMAALGATTFVEVGAGKVLSGLVKRTVPEAATFSLNTPADMDEFLKTVG